MSCVEWIKRLPENDMDAVFAYAETCSVRFQAAFYVLLISFSFYFCFRWVLYPKLVLHPLHWQYQFAC